MQLQTAHFGVTQIDPKCILHFEEGLLGFEHLKRYAVIVSEQTEPIRWLQAIDEPSVALPVIDPFLIKPDYEVEVDDSELHALAAKSESTMIVLGVMVLPDNLSLATLNLAAPLLINVATNRGMQYVMEATNDNPLRYPAYTALMNYYKERNADAGSDTQGE